MPQLIREYGKGVALLTAGVKKQRGGFVKIPAMAAMASVPGARLGRGVGRVIREILPLKWIGFDVVKFLTTVAVVDVVKLA